MVDNKSLYAPEWVYEVSVGLTIYDFITKEFTLDMVAKKFSDGLSEVYLPIPPEELSAPAEQCMRFMSEIKQSEFEAHERTNHFIHYRLKFEGLTGARKMKGLFGSAFDGDKEKKYNETKTLKDFKAFTFSLRSGTVPKAPSGWLMKNELEIGLFKDLLAKDFSIDDLL